MSAQTLGLRERKKQAVRDRIHEEAAGLIQRYGIDGTTIEAVCDCSDIAKKTFYNYYSSRQELLIELCQSRMLKRTSVMIDEAIAHSDSLHEQLAFYFHGMKQHFSGMDRLQKELIDFMVCNFSDNRSAGASQLSYMNDCFTRLFKHSATDLKDDFSPAFYAQVTVGMINTITLNWLVNDKYDISKKLDQLLEYIVVSMLAERTAA
ncbi:MAG: TetR/AcrR family transcriptional regulator [Endozoicomonas sp.]